MRHTSVFASGFEGAARGLDHSASAKPRTELGSSIKSAEPGGLRILAPGRNCWRVARAERAAVLVDAAAYFARLDQALRAARRSILILGWDFDASIKLRPQDGEDAERLGALLRSLVEARPELEIRILIWNLSTLHAPSAALPLLLGEEWQQHPRIKLRLDWDHPVYAAQHQKIVAIDDGIAFVGGIDITVDRWDTPAHDMREARRAKPDGTPYGPVHDMMMLVSGEAARAVNELARHRWRQVTGEEVAAVAAEVDAWPAGLDPDFGDVPVGIARTCPAWGKNKAVHEVAELTRDALSAARRSVYIEAQYFADFRLAEIIERRLREPDGPEIVVIVTRTMHGFVEDVIMNGNRRRLIRRLKRADRFGRLRVWHPCVPGDEGDCEVLIHAKLVIVDNDFLRIGSSNLNNRSTGLDAECDLAIEAHAARRGVAAIRARLLGEHLGASPDAVATAVAETGSLIRAIDRLNGGPRGLRPFDVTEEGPVKPIFGTRLLDPRKPLRLLAMLRPWRRKPKRPGMPRPAASSKAP